MGDLTSLKHEAVKVKKQDPLFSANGLADMAGAWTYHWANSDRPLIPCMRQDILRT